MTEMNAQKLYFVVDRQPKETDCASCEKCNRIHQDLVGFSGNGSRTRIVLKTAIEQAEACCRPTICEHGETPPRSYCSKCWQERHAANMAKKLEEAELVENYEGWIHTDGYHGSASCGEGWSQSVSDFLE